MAYVRIVASTIMPFAMKPINILCTLLILNTGYFSPIVGVRINIHVGGISSKQFPLAVPGSTRVALKFIVTDS